MLELLKNFRKEYNSVRNALPFLDCYVSDLAASWDDVPALPPTDYRKLSTSEGKNRLVIQTDHTFDEIEAMAKAEPEINFIIASGTKKLLYHIEAVSRLIKEYANIYVCTGNFCNVFALEDMVKAGCADKLLYGTMTPYLDPGQAIGPVVLGDFDWETKCAIAGNNFRKLLGEAPVIPPAMPNVKMPAILIDAHGHTANAGSKTPFPAPNSEPVWEQWEPKLGFFGITHFFNTPGETINNVADFPGRNTRDLCVASGGRVRYFEGFDPRDVEGSLKELRQSLPDEMCIGIKIHPAEHVIDADVPEYEEVYKIAAEFDKPIMTHSWGVSDYNPRQKCASPERFDKWLTAYPQARFVFGHTGGRPNGFVHAVAMCKKHPQCMTDLAGDLFNGGFLTHALKEIGADRIMFATDMYWIDPRCTLGMLMEQPLSDEDMLKILRTNAEKFYLKT
ncbi:MAG: amidohydrolase family protein [Lentisphaeria bacterium]|nr:amidohydrolase family protein [Lentisphaeria bacterium]